MTLDSFDVALLNEIQNNARLTAKELGEKVNLSTASVSRRLASLRKKGIIKSEVAVLDGAALGIAMTFIVGVEVEKEQSGLIENFIGKMLELPAVQQCYYVFGDLDFILIVKARDMEDFKQFCEQAFAGNVNLKRFRTFVVMTESKVSLQVPLP